LGKIAFYTKESVNVATSEGLKRRGINILAARDAGNLGLSDEEQLNYVAKNNFVIVTHDDDFLTMAIKYDHKGIVYVHQQKYGVGDLIRKLKLLWDVAEQEDFRNHVEFL